MPKHQSARVDRTFWIVTAVLGILSVILSYCIIVTPLDYILPGASLHVADRGDDIDFLFRFMGVVSAVIFVYVIGYLIYFSVAFRRRRDDEPGAIGVQIHDSHSLEFWWTLVPTILVAILAVLSVQVWARVQFGSGVPALTVEVIGHQFNYEFRYPGLQQSYFSNVEPMHLPVGRQVRVLVTSADVIHSFWVPEMRMKADTVPGLVQNLNFTPQHAGTYDIVCTEFCGVNHSRMQAKLIVQSSADFDAWLAGMKKKEAVEGNSSGGAALAFAAGKPEAGKALFAQKCSSCHQIAPFDQKLVGPGLAQLTDDAKHPLLVNGQSPTAEHIAGILQNGYSGPIGMMPNQQANGLSSQDIANLVAYLTSLK
jgi:cytochrome c oxidase subunit II